MYTLQYVCSKAHVWFSFENGFFFRPPLVSKLFSFFPRECRDYFFPSPMFLLRRLSPRRRHSISPDEPILVIGKLEARARKNDFFKHVSVCQLLSVLEEGKKDLRCLGLR